MENSDLRRQSQLAFLESDMEIEVGSLTNLPIALSELKSINQNSAYVACYFNSGLTAEVFKLNIKGTHWTLKKKRQEILVKNVDGQTSFLNEIQRRRDFESLKTLNPELYRGIVDTTYASLKHGIILSPWIDGDAIPHFSQSQIEDLFTTLYAAEIAGLFEYDLCSGNLLVQKDGKVRLFDFGYMYPFNPLTEYNPDGRLQPIFHGVERFETRCYMQQLMAIEDEIGLDAALEAFRIEKTAALNYYFKKRAWLIENGADDDVIHWIVRLIDLWEASLSDPIRFVQLYNLESFRSYVLDIHDDISGKSCTPATLKKVNRVLDRIESSYAFLKVNQGLFWGDEELSQPQLICKYIEMKEKVKAYQIR